MNGQVTQIGAADFEAILESVPELILVVDGDGRIRYINRVEPGYDRRMFLGLSADDLMAVESRRVFDLHLELVLHTGEPTEYEVEVPLPDGLSAWYKTRMVPIPGADRARSVLLIAEDITEMKRKEAEAVDLRRLLPKCSWCERILNEHGQWEIMEEFLGREAETDVSHGLCPNCHRRQSAGWNDGDGAPRQICGTG